MDVDVKHSVLTTVTIFGEKITVSISKKGIRMSTKSRKTKYILTHSWEDIWKQFEEMQTKKGKAKP